MNSRLLHNLIYNQRVLIDRKGTRLQVGDIVRYKSSSKGTIMTGKVAEPTPAGECIKVQIQGDPFPVHVSYKQLQKSRKNAYKDNESERSEQMAVAEKTKPSAKALRKEAKSLGIEGYEDMSLSELRAAVAEAQEETEEVVEKAPRKAKKDKDSKAKSNGQATKKKKSKKAAEAPAKEAETAPTAGATRGNPYRPGSNLWHIVEELKTGGTRDEIVRRLMPKVKLYPRVHSGRQVELEIVHGRIMSAARALKKIGWKVEREGRGAEATIKAVPPRRK